MPRFLSFATDHRLGNNGFAGRVCGDDIRLGDHFVEEFQAVSHISGEKRWTELFPTAAIDLTVVRIEAWGREMKEISRGYTCLLEFDGDISCIPDLSLIGDAHTVECHEAELAASRSRESDSV
jgi:hypothetical protein